MTKSPRMITLLFLTLTVSLSWGFSQPLAQTNSISIQVASYVKAADAQAAVNRLLARKLDAYWVKAEIPGIGTRYRVRIGHYSGEDAATAGAAQACKSGLIGQYLVATGDNLPVGVPANTCKAALEIAARLKPAANKPEQGTASLAASAPATATKQPAASGKEIKAVAPSVVAPKGPEKSLAKQPSVSPKVANLVGPAKVVTKPESKNAVTPPPPSVAPTPTPVTSVTKSSPKVVTTNFIPAVSPKDIVANAYNYAAARTHGASTKPLSGNGAVSESLTPPNGVNSMIARSIATPGMADDVAIANPKWKVSQTNVTSDKNLRAVHFVDSWTGWAAGDGGTIYQTSDGGKQWNPIRNATLAGSVVDVNRIYFLNENRGWMLAESQDKNKTLLLSTEDGGKIWRNFEMPNVTNFFFVDGKNGWAVGKNSTLMHTADGGIKWKPVENLSRLVGLPVESASLTFGFSDVYFLKGGEIGWAVGNFYGPATTNIGGLFMTTNGGETWQRIPIAIQRKTNSTRFTKGNLQSVRFSDVSNGMITGEMEDGDEHFFFTLKTRNGGETWEQARVPSTGAHSTQFVDAARGWTAASAAREGSAEAKIYDTILLRTDNGGRSWVTDFIAKGKQIRGVFFLSPTRGWAVGDRGMILRYEAK